jgi:hypothetical protein
VTFPPLVEYATREEYKRHYENTYCRSAIMTFDNIRVFFQTQRFGHAFYLSSDRSGNKDGFAWERAKRIDWIKAALAYDAAELYQGWNKDTNVYVPERRVSVVVNDYVVVIEMYFSQNKQLRAKFITAYVADDGGEKIRRLAPKWTLEECLAVLENKNAR